MAHVYLAFLIAVLFVVSVSGQHSTQSLQDTDACNWVLNLTTGSDATAATNATIGIYILRPIGGGHYAVANLNKYNRLRGPNVPRTYLPFRVNQSDYFEFQGPCSPFVCKITFESSGTGTGPAWQLATAEATITVPGVPLRKIKAKVNGWVADNREPYNDKLTVNFCSGAITNPKKALN